MSSKSARRSTDYRKKKRRFYVNQHFKDKTLEPVAIDVTSASSKKLCLDSCSYQSNSNENVASMNKAAKEEISASKTNEICVSGDGIWKTQGYTSCIGVCSIIGDITGKAIDVEVLSSYCKGFDQWKSLKYRKHIKNGKKAMNHIA
ncbi:hypothetical protein TNCV_644271 [Trichonephila clavipes]|nr:hypothetical protein TNCV_644271 [Trichonephila clavipes]